MAFEVAGSVEGAEPQCAKKKVLIVEDNDLNMKLFNDLLEGYGYARALSRDAVAADELVQDCLFRALAKQHLWQEGTRSR